MPYLSQSATRSRDLRSLPTETLQRLITGRLTTSRSSAVDLANSGVCRVQIPNPWVLKRNEGSMRRALCAALFFLVGFNPALGEVQIEASTGGEVSHYLELFAVLRQSGERIVIDGPCYSACTLVLSTIPHNRVCVTRRGSALTE
jgi:hypothetical protein